MIPVLISDLWANSCPHYDSRHYPPKTSCSLPLRSPLLLSLQIPTKYFVYCLQSWLLLFFCWYSELLCSPSNCELKYHTSRPFFPLSLRHDAAKSTCLCSKAKTVFISVDNVHRLYPHNWHIIYSTYASVENVMQFNVLGRWTTAEKSSFLVYVGAKS